MAIVAMFDQQGADLILKETHAGVVVFGMDGERPVEERDEGGGGAGDAHAHWTLTDCMDSTIGHKNEPNVNQKVG